MEILKRAYTHVRTLWPGASVFLPLPWVIWPFVQLALGGFRFEHFAFIFLIPAFAYWSPRTKRLFLGGFPIGLVAIVYDSMRYWKDVGVSPERVHLCDLRAFDMKIASTSLGSVHDWFQAHPSKALDLICAVPYGTFIPAAFSLAVFLYFRDYPRMVRFTWTFALLNFAGFATYHLYPAAPPWYYHAHGCVVDMTAHASEGPNLARVDQILGFPYFGTMYGRSSDIFGAMPSLHVAYPTIIALFGWPRFNWPLRVLTLLYTFTMIFAAIYLDHHWIIDVLMGLLFTFVIFFTVRGLPRWVARLRAKPVAAAALTLLGCEQEPAVPTKPVASAAVVAPAGQLTVEQRATTFVEELSRGEYTHPKTKLAGVMMLAVPPEKLKEAWEAITGASGAFEKIEGTKVETDGEVKIVSVTTKFARGRLVMRVPFDAANDVIGLRVMPVWSLPSYADATTYTEQPAQVGTLPGTLSMPKKTNVPGVVLVHGSGPSDQDETVGGAKVFGDLSSGLASRGIAVLRYTKRSKIDPTIKTEKEEVLDGAHDAIELLKKTPNVDPKRIFVVGHSQGAALAPWIAKDNPGVAGIVIMAGPLRTFQQMVVDQLTYISSLHPDIPELKEQIEIAKKMKAQLDSPTLKKDDKVHTPWGTDVVGEYFLFSRSYDPAKTAAALDIPIFVLQGKRDYQITMKDFAGWEKALAAKPKAKLSTYESLNHLFTAGTGAPNPDEYERPDQHVDATVVSDIATFVGK